MMTASNGFKVGSISLGHLPDEVLQHILAFVSPDDTLDRFQLISKRCHEICSEPLLWRKHCRTSFTYWNSSHQIREKYLSRVTDVGWKKLYTYRRNVDRIVSELLEEILAGQTNRLSRYEAVARYGYDAKDTLLKHCKVADNADDVLARRYFAMSALDHIQRSKALAEWSSMLKGQEVSLERALGAFDMFVLHDKVGDMDEISEIFDKVTAQFLSEHPDINNLSIRQKAVAVATFLKHHNFTGLDNETSYRDMQNNFIGLAMQDPQHPSLPLISCAIFCCLVGRLGLDGRCCGIPSHVHAMVYAPEGQTLDGRDAGPGSPREIMYLDPYNHGEEVPVENLKRMLNDWGVHSADHDGILLEHNNALSVVLRTSRNILATIHAFRTTVLTMQHTPSMRLHGDMSNDLEHAFYSSLWASFIFATPDLHHQRQRRQFVPLLLEKFEAHFPEDASLIEKYICPLFDPHAMDDSNLFDVLRVVKAADQTPKQIRHRNVPGQKGQCKYRVGQVFRHRRYNYTAVIIGWDAECSMDSNWIAHNRVDALARGRHQGFYHALSSTNEETSIRYVAEDNIEVITPEVPIALMGVAGRYFKRWDKETRVFVSNIRDEYPED